MGIYACIVKDHVTKMLFFFLISLVFFANWCGECDRSVGMPLCQVSVGHRQFHHLRAEMLFELSLYSASFLREVLRQISFKSEHRESFEHNTGLKDVRL